MEYNISIVRITATTALVYTSTEDAGLAMPFTIYASDGTTVIESVSVTDPRWGTIEPSCVGITGLTPATTYIAKLTDEPSISTTFTTLADFPKVALESMWADLASKVKSKADASTVPSVVQTTGTSTTDVMSQDVATKMVYVGGTSSTKNNICIGEGARSRNVSTTAVGKNADANGTGATAIGLAAIAAGEHSVALRGVANGDGSVALGIGANATAKGVIDAGTSGSNTPSQYGYNSSNYRLLTGLYDPQSDHDAATKGYCDNAIINGGTTAPTNATAGAVGTQYTYVDTTGTPTAHLCVCTAIDTTDPNNPTYTWQQLI